MPTASKGRMAAHSRSTCRIASTGGGCCCWCRWRSRYEQGGAIVGQARARECHQAAARGGAAPFDLAGTVGAAAGVAAVADAAVPASVAVAARLADDARTA